MISNLIERNVGTKGPIYVTMEDEISTNEVFILSNNFTHNLGIFGSASIYVKTIAK